MTVDEKNKLKSIKEITKEQTNKIVILFLYIIKKSEKTSKFGDAKVNKKEFHASKEPIALYLLDINQIINLTNVKVAIKVLNILLAMKTVILLDLSRSPPRDFGKRWRSMSVTMVDRRRKF